MKCASDDGIKNKWGERLRPIISIIIIKSNAKKMT
jgi:hypothetical protein